MNAFPCNRAMFACADTGCSITSSNHGSNGAFLLGLAIAMPSPTAAASMPTTLALLPASELDSQTRIAWLIEGPGHESPRRAVASRRPNLRQGRGRETGLRV
ncbi:unnamed protein product [Cercospora beticola]|nr:unnamed protein product [Cercospora beticola]